MIEENYATVEAIAQMLNCACSRDGYVLAIMSIVVFRVLGGYESAAREVGRIGECGEDSAKLRLGNWDTASMKQKTHPHLRTMNIHGDDGEEEDKARVAAQLVLSELHRVQRIVNLLSARLKARIKGQNVFDRGMGSQRGVRGSFGEGPNMGRPSSQDEGYFKGDGRAGMAEANSLSGGLGLAEPFSEILFEQLECDLRKRLRGLSLEIVDMLRRD